MATKKPNTEEVKKPVAKKTADKATKVAAKKTTAKKTTDKVTTPPKKAPVKRNPKQAALPLPACTVDDLKPKAKPKAKAKVTIPMVTNLETVANSLIESHINSPEQDTPAFDPPYETKSEPKPVVSSRKGISITELMNKKAENTSKSPLDGFFVPRR